MIVNSVHNKHSIHRSENTFLSHYIKSQLLKHNHITAITVDKYNIIKFTMYNFIFK